MSRRFAPAFRLLALVGLVASLSACVAYPGGRHYGGGYRGGPSYAAAYGHGGGYAHGGGYRGGWR